MMKLRIALVLLFSGAALAGTATSVPGDFVLKNLDGTYPAPYTALTARFSTLAACDAAAAGLNRTMQYKCDVSYKGTAVATCENEKAPHIPLVKNAEGAYVEPEAQAFPPDTGDTEWRTLQWLYVHNATWPSGYPTCWVRGFADPDEWRVNGADQNAVFMERIEPGMIALEDQPNDTTPNGWTPPGPYCPNGDCSVA